MRFSASSVSGSSRGHALGFPTVNLNVRELPSDFCEGVYAARASVNGETWHAAALHYGPKPTFHEGLSAEVHLLDVVLETLPPRLEVEVVGRLRDVREFPDPDALRVQIATDVAAVRAMIGT